MLAWRGAGGARRRVEDVVLVKCAGGLFRSSLPTAFVLIATLLSSSSDSGIMVWFNGLLSLLSSPPRSSSPSLQPSFALEPSSSPACRPHLSLLLFPSSKSPSKSSIVKSSTVKPVTSSTSALTICDSLTFLTHCSLTLPPLWRGGVCWWVSWSIVLNFIDNFTLRSAASVS